MRRILTTLLFLLLLATEQARAEADPVAAIYEKSGVQGGLVVELGLVDAEFTARLGAPDSVQASTARSPSTTSTARRFPTPIIWST